MDPCRGQAYPVFWMLNQESAAEAEGGESAKTAKALSMDPIARDAFLNTAFELAPLGMAIVSPQGSLERVNRFFCELLGYAREELIGKNFSSFTHPDDKELSTEEFNQIVSSGAAPLRLEKRYRKKDGSTVEIVLHSAPVHDESGRTLALISVFEDVGARNEAARQLLAAQRAQRREQERYRALAEFSPIGIWQIDTEGFTQYLNPKMLQMLGLTVPSDLDGTTFHQFIAPEDLKQMSSEHALRPDGVASTYQVTLLGKGGTRRPVLIVGSPLVDGDGKLEGLMGSFVDLAERRALEADLRHLQKLDSVGRLAAGIAHDFNNLLMIIQAHLFTSAEEPLDEGQKESLDSALLASRRAADLTRQLLVFSRKQPMQQRVLEWNEATQRSLGMLRRILGADTRLRVDLSGRQLNVSADPGMLDHVLINLAVNARDAMDKKGIVEISTSVFVCEGWGFPGALDAPPGNYCRLSISDSGPGIPAELASQIFEPFFTTKAAGEGTGLGLSTAAEILRQHGGWLTVESKEQEGATFHLTLPAATAHATPTLLERQRRESNHQGARVLVVEAQPNVGQFLTGSLNRAGLRAQVTQSPIEASARLQTERFDVLVFDLETLPLEQINRYVDELRQHQPDLKAILMTSGRSSPTSLDAPGVKYLFKPFSSENLVAGIDALLQK